MHNYKLFFISSKISQSKQPLQYQIFIIKEDKTHRDPAKITHQQHLLQELELHSK
jgi:hypothetical protein